MEKAQQQREEAVSSMTRVFVFWHGGTGIWHAYSLWMKVCSHKRFLPV